MKKIKLIIPFFIVLCIIIVLYWKLPNPIDKINLNEVKSVAVYSVGGDSFIDYLTDDEINHLINVINSAEFSKIGTDKYKYYNGGTFKMFCIEMQDTTKIDLASTPHYLAINEKGYRCDDATLDYINQLYNKYEAEHYPIAVR